MPRFRAERFPVLYRPTGVVRMKVREDNDVDSRWIDFGRVQSLSKGSASSVKDRKRARSNAHIDQDRFGRCPQYECGHGTGHDAAGNAIGIQRGVALPFGCRNSGESLADRHTSAQV
jgi:hypothetical protein